MTTPTTTPATPGVALPAMPELTDTDLRRIICSITGGNRFTETERLIARAVEASIRAQVAGEVAEMEARKDAATSTEAAKRIADRAVAAIEQAYNDTEQSVPRDFCGEASDAAYGAVMDALVAGPAPVVQAVREPGLSMAQEPKYTVNGSAIVNRASGEEIPADEPVFVFRARDRRARYALQSYVVACGETAHTLVVMDRIVDFERFAEQYPERMKEPDTATSLAAVAEPEPKKDYFRDGRLVDHATARMGLGRKEAIDMVLFCPNCGTQHIDAPEEEEYEDASGHLRMKCDWTNPPRRSHLCHACEHIWRPADVPTNGVAAVKTKGLVDSPITKSFRRNA